MIGEPLTLCNLDNSLFIIKKRLTSRYASSTNTGTTTSIHTLLIAATATIYIIEVMHSKSPPICLYYLLIKIILCYLPI